MRVLTDVNDCYLVVGFTKSPLLHNITTTITLCAIFHETSRELNVSVSPREEKTIVLGAADIFNVCVLQAGIHPHSDLSRNTRRSILSATATHYNVITVFNMWSLHQYLIINITAGLLTANTGPAGD